MLTAIKRRQVLKPIALRQRRKQLKMKNTSFLLLLLLSFLLISISTTHHSFCSAAKSSPEPVHDIFGNRLRVDQPYSILPFDNRTGRGFVMEVTNNKTCPFDVVQAQDYYEIPLQLYPANSKKGDIVRMSTDLNVFFWNTFTSCLLNYSNFWKLDKYDNSTGKYFVTTGGVKGNPGPKTISNWFKIEKSRNGFKFVYCPSVCKYCKVLCKDVGIFVQNGLRRAALDDVPFEFNFKKFTGY
ncbi:hypothetical protein M9H77_12258 [Catharanthus roseus]|uniref:Uncharacterized protein n=1 Tax=Catharanthus roseus TaxID=4058 RepID=A0ACC0BGX4_CATRO|nr:hypothetical protein M9H77_12258 [Catharanthus roseus]